MGNTNEKKQLTYGQIDVILQKIEAIPENFLERCEDIRVKALNGKKNMQDQEVLSRKLIYFIPRN